MGGARVLLNSGWLVLVLAFVLPAIWWRGRRAGNSTMTLLLRSAFVGWAAALLALTLFPLPLPPYTSVDPAPDPRGWPAPWASLVPFATISASFGDGWDLGAGRYLVGNIGAFIPLGLLASVLSPRWRSWCRTLALGLAVTLVIETTQLVLSLAIGFPWRVADVDDVLLNVLGTVLGYGLWTFGGTLVGWSSSGDAA